MPHQVFGWKKLCSKIAETWYPCEMDCGFGMQEHFILRAIWRGTTSMFFNDRSKDRSTIAEVSTMVDFDDFRPKSILWFIAPSFPSPPSSTENVAWETWEHGEDRSDIKKPHPMQCTSQMNTGSKPEVIKGGYFQQIGVLRGITLLIPRLKTFMHTLEIGGKGNKRHRSNAIPISEHKHERWSNTQREV